MKRDPLPNQVEITCLADAIALLDQWILAHAELLRAYRRLEVRCDNEQSRADSAEWLLERLDPFLPPSMQRRQWREAEPVIYRALGELRDEEHDPFR